MVSTVKIEMDPRAEDQDMPDASVGLRLKAKPVKSSIFYWSTGECGL
jgi:hypothetical protein